LIAGLRSLPAIAGTSCRRNVRDVADSNCFEIPGNFEESRASF